MGEIFVFEESELEALLVGDDNEKGFIFFREVDPGCNYHVMTVQTGHGIAFGDLTEKDIHITKYALPSLEGLLPVMYHKGKGDVFDADFLSSIELNNSGFSLFGYISDSELIIFSPIKDEFGYSTEFFDLKTAPYDKKQFVKDQKYLIRQLSLQHESQREK